MIKITWNAITLLLLVLACSILFFVCNKSNKLEQVKAPTFNTDKLETKIANLIQQVDSLKSEIKNRVEVKEKIITNYRTKLVEIERLTDTQVVELYKLDTMSPKIIAGYIEEAKTYKSLYNEQMGIDSMRQQVVVNLDKVTASQATEIRLLKRKLESRNWWLKTVSAICGAAIVGIFIK